MSSVVNFPHNRRAEQAVHVEPGLPMEFRLAKVLYTVKETAELMSLGLSTVYDLINQGDLPKIMVGPRGKTARIAADDIKAYIDNNRVEATTSWVS